MKTIRFTTTFARYLLACLWLAFTAIHTAPVLAQSHDALLMNGIDTAKHNGSDLYVGALYLRDHLATPDIIAFAQMKKRMEIRVVTPVWRKRSFSKYWSQAILLNNSKEQQDALIDDILAFVNLPKKNLERGDRITVDYTPAVGTTITINDTVAFVSKDDAYFAAVLRAWIGSHPPSSSFKSNITAPSKEHKANLAEQLRTIEPSDKAARYTEVASWYGENSGTTVVAAPVTTPAQPSATATPKPEPAAKPVEKPVAKAPAKKPEKKPVEKKVVKVEPKKPDNTPETMEEVDDVKAWLLERLGEE